MNYRSYKKPVWYHVHFLTAVILLVVSAVGCTTTEQVFVATADSPENPIIAVVPANNGLYQHHFANFVEEKVIESGLSVTQRPSVVNQEISQGAEMAQLAGDAQAAKQTAVITQSYSRFEESSADYLVQTYTSSNQVRIVEKASQRVLASFELILEPEGGTSFEKTEDPFLKALEEIGLPVKERDEQ
jgi:hypothetical protein